MSSTSNSSAEPGENFLELGGPSTSSPVLPFEPQTTMVMEPSVSASSRSVVLTVKM